jgi:hypothetical protein
MSRHYPSETHPRNGKAWTEHEDNRLREMSRNSVSIQDMSRDLGRSQGSIMQRGTHLRVRVTDDRSVGQRRRRNWTPEEDEIAMTCTNVNECTEKLPHRTVGSIWQRRATLRDRAGIRVRRGESQIAPEVRGGPTSWDLDRVQYSASRPSEDMLMDAAIRRDMPRPIVAWIQGDPPPGYSALDRRRES